MKGKSLENIILTVGLLVIGAAIFLMFIDDTGKVAQRVNLIFSIGFIFYIAYSYLLSRNLNEEITTRDTHIKNLKEEVGRQKETIAVREKTIGENKAEINRQTAEINDQKKTIATQTQALETANARLAELEKQDKPEA